MQDSTLAWIRSSKGGVEPEEDEPAQAQDQDAVAQSTQRRALGGGPVDVAAVVSANETSRTRSTRP